MIFIARVVLGAALLVSAIVLALSAIDAVNPVQFLDFVRWVDVVQSAALVMLLVSDRPWEREP